MGVAKFDRFTDPLFLKQIGRPLLEKFLQRFEPALAGRSVPLPPRGAMDQEFFNLLAHLLMCPEGLPEEMSEAIHTINEMASTEGQQRIEQLIQQSGSALEIPEESSQGDIAMHVWLSAPDSARNEIRIKLPSGLRRACVQRRGGILRTQEIHTGAFARGRRGRAANRGCAGPEWSSAARRGNRAAGIFIAKGPLQGQQCVWSGKTRGCCPASCPPAAG